MYFDDILYELSLSADLAKSEKNSDEIKRKNKKIFALTAESFISLIAVVEATLSNNVSKLYDNDDYTFNVEPIVYRARIRPKKEYYEYNGLPLPLPIDPNGPFHTGIELVLNTYWDSKYNRPEILLELNIDGHYEREGFKKFYYDYRRMIGSLLNSIKPDFFTSNCFEKIEKNRSKDINKILDLYFDEEDDENDFSIQHYFVKDDLHKTIRAFLILFSIFDSCYHYISPKKKYDLLPDYYIKLL